MVIMIMIILVMVPSTGCPPISIYVSQRGDCQARRRSWSWSSWSWSSWSWWQVQDVLQSVYVCPSEEAAKPAGEGNGLISITQNISYWLFDLNLLINVHPINFGGMLWSPLHKCQEGHGLRTVHCNTQKSKAWCKPSNTTKVYHPLSINILVVRTLD